ncbi:MAG: C1 family peptidase [Eubacteriales bacterium]|nr:C1 family peptidase [Eubacteriales bacterium]
MNHKRLTAFLTAAALSLTIIPAAVYAEDAAEVTIEAASETEDTVSSSESLTDETQSEDSMERIVDDTESEDIPLQDEEAGSERPVSDGASNFGYKSGPEKPAPEAVITADDDPEDSLLGAPAIYPANPRTILSTSPRVRNQGNGDTCWAFGTIATAEYDAIKKGYAGTNVDYSEMALAYSTYSTSPVDPLGGLYGDWNSYTEGDFLSTGGVPRYAMNTLFQWAGVVAESKVPYNDSNPYLTLSDHTVRDDDLHITEARYMNIKTNPLQVKNWIMNHGAVAASFYGDGAARNSSYYSSSYNSYYCPFKQSTNHTIAIVGWNDNFSRMNFSGSYGYPSTNGAWLIRNSWNSDGINDFGADTYFWLSYADNTLADTAVGASYRIAQKNRNNYQYDGSIIDDSIECESGVNVYTCKSDLELLKEVAVGVDSPNTQLDVQVYKNFGNDINNILDMTETASGSLRAAFSGMYTIALNKPVTLKRGDRFAIEVTLTSTAGNTNTALITDCTYYGYYHNSTYYSNARVNQGESYYLDSDDYTYRDMVFIPDFSQGYSLGNLRIKGFGTPISLRSLNLNKHALTLYDGQTQKLTASTSPATDTGTTVVWKSSNPSVASVNKNGTVTTHKKGKAVIRASVFNNSSIYDECTITVKEEPITPRKMYRLYNPNSGEHFYTAAAAERNHLTSVGWKYEGIGWTAPSKSTIPVYRLYNPHAGDHHYTRSAGEKNNLVSLGWKYEGIGWYSDPKKRVPLYRQYNPNAVTGTHNYTTSKAENNYLVRIGWKAEGIGWYGMK